MNMLETKYGLRYENPVEEHRNRTNATSHYEGTIPRIGETVRIQVGDGNSAQDYIVKDVIYPLTKSTMNPFLVAEFPQVVLRRKGSRLVAMCKSLLSKGTPSS